MLFWLLIQWGLAFQCFALKLKSRNTYFFGLGSFSARIFYTFGYFFIIKLLLVSLFFLGFFLFGFFLLETTENILDIPYFNSFFYILVDILNNTKLKFDFPHEELKDSILPKLLSDFRSAIDAETGEYF